MRTQHFARRVEIVPLAESGQRAEHRLGTILSGQYIGEAELLGARGQPCLEPEQRCQIADVIGRPGLVRDRHPFAIGAHCRDLAHAPFALGLGLVVLRPALPTVVGAFVIVPAGDHRVDLMEATQVAIVAIAGEAQPVIGQRHGFAQRCDHASGNRLFGRRVIVRPVFVEIIAQMQRAVELVGFGGMRIGVEPAKADVRTAEHRHAEALGRALGQRLGAADIGHRAIGGDKAIEIPASGLEPFGEGFAAAIVGGAGHGIARSNNTRKVGGWADFPFQFRVRAGGETRPQQYPVARRLTASHAMRKPRTTKLRRQRRGDQPGAEDACFEQAATVQRGKRGSSGGFGLEHGNSPPGSRRSDRAL